jgi:hypothetical protein
MSSTLQFTGPMRSGIAHIGRGVKSHPVRETVYIGYEGKETKSLDFLCSCTGTNNGKAHNKATVYWGNYKANCRT